MMKVCTKCGINHPLNNFNYRKESSDNLTSWCKNCLSIKNKKWAIDNKDYLSEKRKRLRQENPEKYKKAFKEWYDKNSESQRKRANNYRIENPEKVKQRFKKWAYNKRKNDTEYKILTTLRNRINNVTKRQNGEKAFSAIELTGCTVKELKQHLESQFSDGMTDGTGPFISNEIEKLASVTYGIKFNEKNLPKQVLYPLEKIGYITLSRGTKQSGRGAKPFAINLTDKFKKEILKPLTEQFEKQVQSDLRPLLRKNIKDIIKDINSTNIHIKGLALEALGFKILRLLDIDYLATRLRGSDTGGAEVDLIFQTSRLIFSRWQVQCKNTTTVRLDDVAKEVGLTHFLKSNVIVMLSTGKIGTEARKYSNKIMSDSNLCIVLIDGDDISKIIKNPTNIVEIFNREARQAMKLKNLEL